MQASGNSFSYHYAAPRNAEAAAIRKKYVSLVKRKDELKMSKDDQEFLVQKIRTQYVEKEHTQLDQLKKLDQKVKRPAKVFAYALGTVSALIMGSGMSLVMTDIGQILGFADVMIPGITIGVAGLLLAIINYPIYKGILSSRKKKYAREIINLSDRILK